MKVLLISLALIYSPLAYSAGWQWLHGKNKSGVELFVFPSEAQNMYELVSLDKNNKFAPQAEECFFKYTNDGKNGMFYCSNKHNSLLSGVSYKITQNSNLNDCEYYAKFVCIKGCEKKGLPQLLIQDHWECF
jgi:hypothetical protein